MRIAHNQKNMERNKKSGIFVKSVAYLYRSYRRLKNKQRYIITSNFYKFSPNDLFFNWGVVGMHVYNKLNTNLTATRKKNIWKK